MIQFLFFISLFFASTFAENATKEQATQIYSEAISADGNLEKAERAEKAFQILEAENPSFYNRIRLASLVAVRAKHSSLFRRMGLANEAIDKFTELEKEILGVQDVETLYEFHLFRGRTYFQFPSILNKKDVAKKDIKEAILLLPKLANKRNAGEIARLYLSFAIILKDENELEKASEYAKKALAFNTLEEQDKLQAQNLQM
jgi:tetratricopeptide (TPR) repeat protein